MIWRIVVVILFGGHEAEFIELVGAEYFNSRIECNEQALKYAALPIMAPFAITCIGEVHA
jgi:hypothetical protein